MWLPWLTLVSLSLGVLSAVGLKHALKADRLSLTAWQSGCTAGWKSVFS